MWNSIEPFYWGRLSYQEADALQKNAMEKVRMGHCGYLLAGEVDFVVTQGIRGKQDHILSPDIQAVQTHRGGETTLHSPGQLLIYPVLNLKNWNAGVKFYVDSILRISRKTFAKYQLATHVKTGQVGLWTEKGKLAFCGVQIKNGITQHGLSLNIQNDLNLFNKITSCGIQNGTYDKLGNHQQNLSAEEFFKTWYFAALEDGATIQLKPTEIQI